MKKTDTNTENTNTENKNTEKISQEDIMKTLDYCYDLCLNGVPKISDDVITVSEEYLNKYKDKEIACKKMIKNQIIKCTTSGFITGFGGIITLPVSIPANLTSVIYVQMRMIASIAYIGGYDLDSDETKTFVYACLAGVAVNGIIKQAGLKFGMKFANVLVKKIPGKTIVKINQKVGMRFLTKFGTKGVVNIGKMIPGVGAVIGGSFDFLETKIIANRAYKWFIENDFSVENDEKTDEDLILQ